MKENKPVNPKGNQPWRFIGRTDVEKDWRQKEKGTKEDKMVGWDHQLNGHEFEQTPGDSEGKGSLECWSPWGHKEPDTAEWLNNNSQMWRPHSVIQHQPPLRTCLQDPPWQNPRPLPTVIHRNNQHGLQPRQVQAEWMVFTLKSHREPVVNQALIFQKTNHCLLTEFMLNIKRESLRRNCRPLWPSSPSPSTPSGHAPPLPPLPRRLPLILNDKPLFECNY